LEKKMIRSFLSLALMVVMAVPVYAQSFDCTKKDMLIALLEEAQDRAGYEKFYRAAGQVPAEAQTNAVRHVVRNDWDIVRPALRMKINAACR
jgi:hypothetical protein